MDVEPSRERKPVQLSPRKRAAAELSNPVSHSILRSRTRAGREEVDSVDEIGWRRSDDENWRPDRCVMAPHHTARDCACEACANLSLSSIYIIPRSRPRYKHETDLTSRAHTRRVTSDRSVHPAQLSPEIELQSVVPTAATDLSQYTHSYGPGRDMVGI